MSSNKQRLHYVSISPKNVGNLCHFNENDSVALLIHQRRWELQCTMESNLLQLKVTPYFFVFQYNIMVTET